MQSGEKIYFLSDFHLGAPDAARSLEREKRIVAFLHEAAKDAQEIFLLGDLFDFWFEWRKAVPRGFTRLLGTLAELSDRGIPIHLFLGNHDMWTFDYLPTETGVTVHRAPIERTIQGKRFLIGHGDGLGPGDLGYKFIKQVFRNPLCQWLFARLHPNFALGLGDFWSGRSRTKNYENDRKWLGADKEWLVQYSKDRLVTEHFDYLVFGHRHLPVDMVIPPTRSITQPDLASASGQNSRDGEHGESRYINLGDWITHFTYAVLDSGKLKLMKRQGDGPLDGDVQISGGPAS
jgi:UDP-2,3-diacylglucosamine hydrolase